MLPDFPHLVQIENSVKDNQCGRMSFDDLNASGAGGVGGWKLDLNPPAHRELDFS